MPPGAGTGLPHRRGDRHPGGGAAAYVRDRERQCAPARPLRDRPGRHRHHGPALPGLRQPHHGTDRRPDAGQEATHGGGPARRVRPRVANPPGAGPALQSGGRGAAHVAPVRHHGPGAQLSRQPEPDRPQWPAAGHGPARDPGGVAPVPHRHGAPAPPAPPRQGPGTFAPVGRPAGGLPQHRRGHPHRPQRGRAQACAHSPLRPERRPGGVRPEHQAAPTRPPGRDEDPCRAGGTVPGTRLAAGDPGLGRGDQVTDPPGDRSGCRQVRGRPPLALGGARRRQRLGRDRTGPHRTAHRGPVPEGLGARRQGPRPGSQVAELQGRGRFPRQRPCAQQPGRGLPGLDRAQLFGAGAPAALGPGPGGAADRAPESAGRGRVRRPAGRRAGAAPAPGIGCGLRLRCQPG